MPPDLQYAVIDESSLQVFWEEPYTTEEFPITSYFLRIVDANETSENVLIDTVLSPDTHTLNVTAQTVATMCLNLTFEIWAENSIGNSSVGVSYGAFPVSKSSYYYNLASINNNT